MIEFLFDFSSPYGYLASHRLDAIAAAHGRTVTWRPYELGEVFAITGAVPHVRVPLKADYARRDFARSARQHGIPFALPTTFPVRATAAAAAFYWCEDAHGHDAARRLGRAIFDGYFQHGRAPSDPAVVADIGAEAGFDHAEVAAGLASSAARERLSTVTEDAIARGAFGSPYIFVDGEPFWGADRVDMIDAWLTRGGW